MGLTNSRPKIKIKKQL